jgi:hypothetical protein
MRTITWQEEEFTLIGFGKWEMGIISVSAEIEFDERSSTDWSVARVGLYNPFGTSSDTIWLSDKDPLSVALIERINERYSREVALFIREEEYAA